MTLAGLWLAAITGCTPSVDTGGAGGQRWQSGSDGIVVDTDDEAFPRLRLQVIDERSLRVTALPGGHSDAAAEKALTDTLMVVAAPAADGYTVEQRDGELIVATPALSAAIDLTTGRVRYEDARGRLLLAEAGRTASPGADGAYAVRQQFARQPGESWYGLGQRQDGLVDLAGENVELTTHNIIISIPFLTSSNGYGILWNNASTSRIGDPEPAAPLAEDFTLYDAEGAPGGLTARYYDGDELLLEQVVSDLDHQFLAHGSVREQPFPDELADAANPRIEWTGTIEPAQSGEHEFRMYSSGYARLYIDGELRLDRWRMNWNPWYHDTRVSLEAGRRYPLRVDWRTQGGYFRLLQHAPLPAAE
jgi:alpha-D-xyloside xylohydrolase